MSRKNEKTWVDYLFCLIVGSVYIFALSRVVFFATVITVGNGVLFFVALFSVLIFLLLTYNRYTVIALLVSVFLFGLYTANAIRIYFRPAPYGGILPPMLEHFNRLLLMIGGILPYETSLGLTAVWVFAMVLGLFVVIFLFHKFNFYVLAFAGVAVFTATWAPGFIRDEGAFLIFLFAICVVLIRKMNDSVRVSLIIAPLCVLVVFLANFQMPNYSNAFVRRPLTQFVSDTMEDISDFVFHLFNPAYFSFQSTGFSSGSGLLGGPVNPNNRSVMYVRAPGGTYLAGITHNTYTGNRWISTLEDGDIYTHGLVPGHFEMLETMAALLRAATVAQFYEDVNIQNVRQLFAHTSAHNVFTDDFLSLGVLSGYYLHTYMPINLAEIYLGRRRTGTVFRPNRTMDLRFMPTGGNYLSALNVLPMGDFQTPRLMSRNTQYHMQFLDVNPKLPFIGHLLRQTNYGVYAGWQISPERQHATFYGEYHEVWTLDLHGILGVPSEAVGSFNVRESILNNEVIIRYYYEGEHMGYISLGFSPDELLGLANLVEDDALQLIDLFYANDFGVYAMQNLFEILHARGSYIPQESDLLNRLDAFTVNVLADYAAQVRGHFMYVPEIVPQRVFDLTHDIVRYATNDFDRVMALRDYLLQFPYTLSPVPVSADVCFVDHFLFEGQEGYCTYFASAMAVMTRIAGVPSRYVEGFVVPPTRYADYFITITNMMAHAWVEVYLEGFGWLKVEATPPYADLVAAGFPAPGPVGGTGTIHAQDDHWRYMEDAWFVANDYWQDETIPEGVPGAGTVTPAPPGVDHANFTFIILAIPIVIILSMGGLVLISVVRVKHELKTVKKLSLNQQSMAYFLGLINIIIYYSGPMDAGTTLQDYCRDKDRRFAFQNDSVFLRDLIAQYYKARYSPHEITELENKRMRDAYWYTVNTLRQRNSFVKFMQLRYFKRIGRLTERTKYDKKVTLKPAEVTV